MDEAVGTTVHCAVLGSPVEHSLSPVLHRAAYRALGLSGWDYGRHRVEAAELAGFVDGLDASWRGLSLTMPLKEAALDLGPVDRYAELVGAANTLLLPERSVHNTDVPGLALALRAAGVDRVDTVTLLGTGATCRSALASVAELGANRVLVVARTPAKAEPLRELASRLGVALEVAEWGAVTAGGFTLPETDLTVSGVVAGAADALADQVAARSAAVFDVIYHPWPTRLAQAAEQAGRIVCHGLDLLVHQAVEQVRLMTGRAVDASVMMSAGRSELGLPGDL